MVTKRIFVILSFILLFATTWAALHDIAKGETDLYFQYGFFVISILSVPIWIKSFNE